MILLVEIGLALNIYRNIVNCQFHYRLMQGISLVMALFCYNLLYSGLFWYISKLRQVPCQLQEHSVVGEYNVLFSVSKVTGFLSQIANQNITTCWSKLFAVSHVMSYKQNIICCWQTVATLTTDT